MAVSDSSPSTIAFVAARSAFARRASTRSFSTAAGATSSMTVASGATRGAGGAVGCQSPVRIAGVQHGASRRSRVFASTASTLRLTPCMSRAVMRPPARTRFTVLPRRSTAFFAAAPKTASSIGVVAPKSLMINATSSPAGSALTQASASLSATSDAASVGDFSAPGSPWMPRPSSISPGPRRPDAGRPGSVQTS